VGKFFLLKMLHIYSLSLKKILKTMSTRTRREALKKLALFLGLLVLPLAVRAGTTINGTKAYSWGANIGWMTWLADSPADGVAIGEFICSGWIYPAQPGYGILRGYAYGANIGWINFEAQGNPRINLFSGTLSGYAYSANCGWINLNDMGGNYVQTDHIAMGADTNGNGIADAWEYLYFGGLLAPGAQNTDPNGTGMTLLQDYLDGVNPTVTGSGLRITAYSTNAGGTSSNVTFTSTAGRLYTIEVNTDLRQPLNWTDSGLGMITPDVGATSTRNVTQTSATQRFFRVKTMRPLP
jgi:hypothetical protein